MRFWCRPQPAAGARGATTPFKPHLEILPLLTCRYARFRRLESKDVRRSFGTPFLIRAPWSSLLPFYSALPLRGGTSDSRGTTWTYITNATLRD
jgi:hypothetical protein